MKAYRSSEILISDKSTVVLIEPTQGDNYIESLGVIVTFSPNHIAENPAPFIMLIEGIDQNG